MSLYQFILQDNLFKVEAFKILQLEQYICPNPDDQIATKRDLQLFCNWLIRELNGRQMYVQGSNLSDAKEFLELIRQTLQKIKDWSAIPSHVSQILEQSADDLILDLENYIASNEAPQVPIEN